MFDTQIIADQNHFHSLRAEWNKLLQKSCTNTIFLTWEWLYTWWEVFGSGEDIVIIAVRDQKGELLGLAPLFVKKSKYYKVPVKEMSFIGTGHSDRQAFITSGSDSRIIQEIMAAIGGIKEMWDIVRLEQIPSDSLLVSNGFSDDFQREMEESSPCPYVRIQGTWGTYFKSLGRKFGKDIRNKMNKMDRLGKWEFCVSNNVESIEQMVESMARIESESRKGDTKKAFLSDVRNKEFLLRFCKLSKENGWLDYSAISINDILSSYLLGFLYNHRYYAYNIAHVEDMFAVSPGKILLNEKIKWCFENVDSVQEFDFLRGGTYIKSLWASESRKHFRIVFFNNSLFLNVLRYAVFHIRPFINKIFKKGTA